MRASRNKPPPAASASRRLEAFLEIRATNRGEARLTIAASRSGLAGLAKLAAARGSLIEVAIGAMWHDFLAAMTTRHLAPRTLARRLSAMRQFFRFLVS